jgi:hypothetical protein
MSSLTNALVCFMVCHPLGKEIEGTYYMGIHEGCPESPARFRPLRRSIPFGMPNYFYE